MFRPGSRAIHSDIGGGLGGSNAVARPTGRIPIGTYTTT